MLFDCFEKPPCEAGVPTGAKRSKWRESLVLQTGEAKGVGDVPRNKRTCPATKKGGSWIPPIEFINR